eukprot:gene11498-11978_t
MLPHVHSKQQTGVQRRPSWNAGSPRNDDGGWGFAQSGTVTGGGCWERSFGALSSSTASPPPERGHHHRDGRSQHHGGTTGDHVIVTAPSAARIKRGRDEPHDDYHYAPTTPRKKRHSREQNERRYSTECAAGPPPSPRRHRAPTDVTASQRSWTQHADQHPPTPAAERRRSDAAAPLPDSPARRVFLPRIRSNMSDEGGSAPPSPRGHDRAQPPDSGVSAGVSCVSVSPRAASGLHQRPGERRPPSVRAEPPTPHSQKNGTAQGGACTQLLHFTPPQSPSSATSANRQPGASTRLTQSRVTDQPLHTSGDCAA